MSSYFPIPPNIVVDINEEKVIGSLTFLNYPNNFKTKNRKKVIVDDIYIGIYIIENILWKLIKVYKCSYKSFIEINRYSLELSDSEMAVAIIRKNNDFEKYCERLPEPYSLRVDKSPVAERVSYNFSYNSSQTSYQGEYPERMAKISNSSFFSFDALKSLVKSNDVKNYLLLTNLKINPTIEGISCIKVYDPKDNYLVSELKARDNIISVYDLSNHIEASFLDKILFISSNDSTFIPLMLTLNKYNNQLSIEHTHPPTEMLCGADKRNFIQMIKKRWVL
tara:strand:- start:149 stop:985 length:837 start_codon:yes stop_codon:yes gene_type:complete